MSPGTQLCLKALQDRKLVLLCVIDQAGPNGVEIPAAAQRIQGRPTVRRRVGDRARQCGRRRRGGILEGTEGGFEGAHAVHGLARSSRQRDRPIRQWGEQGSTNGKTRCGPGEPMCRRFLRAGWMRAENRCRTVASCMATWACKALSGVQPLGCPDRLKPGLQLGLRPKAALSVQENNSCECKPWFGERFSNEKASW